VIYTVKALVVIVVFTALPLGLSCGSVGSFEIGGNPSDIGNSGSVAASSHNPAHQDSTKQNSDTIHIIRPLPGGFQ
jgi:hypothetical protein